MTAWGNRSVRRVFAEVVRLFAVATFVSVGGLKVSGGVLQLPVSLRETVTPSPLADMREGNVSLAGHIEGQSGSNVLIRVTISHGNTSQIGIAVISNRFRCRYPTDFPPIGSNHIFVIPA
jgi:uncharacterized phosphosugar-binding protein